MLQEDGTWTTSRAAPHAPTNTYPTIDDRPTRGDQRAPKMLRCMARADTRRPTEPSAAMKEFSPAPPPRTLKVICMPAMVGAPYGTPPASPVDEPGCASASSSSAKPLELGVVPSIVHLDLGGEAVAQPVVLARKVVQARRTSLTAAPAVGAASGPPNVRTRWPARRGATAGIPMTITHTDAPQPIPAPAIVLPQRTSNVDEVIAPGTVELRIEPRAAVGDKASDMAIKAALAVQHRRVAERNAAQGQRQEAKEQAERLAVQQRRRAAKEALVAARRAASEREEESIF